MSGKKTRGAWKPGTLPYRDTLSTFVHPGPFFRRKTPPIVNCRTASCRKSYPLRSGSTGQRDEDFSAPRFVRCDPSSWRGSQLRPGRAILLTSSRYEPGRPDEGGGGVHLCRLPPPPESDRGAGFHHRHYFRQNPEVRLPHPGGSAALGARLFRDL